MKINWKSRLRNKAILVPLIAVVTALIYKIAAALGFTLLIDQQEAVEIWNDIVLILSLLGIVASPQSPGLFDGDDTDKDNVSDEINN